MAPYLDTVVPPILESMGRKESSVRYYACECMYNVAKVSKGELLRFFNSVFEAQCKVKETMNLFRYDVITLYII